MAHRIFSRIELYALEQFCLQHANVMKLDGNNTQSEGQQEPTAVSTLAKCSQDRDTSTTHQTAKKVKPVGRGGSNDSLAHQTIAKLEPNARIQALIKLEPEVPKGMSDLTEAARNWVISTLNPVLNCLALWQRCETVL